MNKKRREEIFDKLIGYVSEHSINEMDEYFAFRNIIGMSKDEIIELDLCFENNYEEMERVLKESCKI